MKQIILILALIVLVSGCAMPPLDRRTGRIVRPEGFQPVSPSDAGFDDVNDILAVLPNESVSVAVNKRQKDAEIVYGPAHLSVKNASYEVKVDYIKYQTTQYEDSNDIFRVGVGIRIVAFVKTKKAGIDLGSLYALAVAAENNQLSGTLTMETMGISGEKITPLIPIPSKIDVSTIQNALQAAAAIKSKIYDESKGVVIKAQIVAQKTAEKSEMKAAAAAKRCP